MTTKGVTAIAHMTGANGQVTAQFESVINAICPISVSRICLLLDAGKPGEFMRVGGGQPAGMVLAHIGRGLAIHGRAVADNGHRFFKVPAVMVFTDHGQYPVRQMVAAEYFEKRVGCSKLRFRGRR